ncbi:hypothetical protein NL108_017872 [Boleophthalmus pectinirostris]|nr:hypothetical protein NL108_017872 [Boleophthalmus pectinirostris]
MFVVVIICACFCCFLFASSHFCSCVSSLHLAFVFIYFFQNFFVVLVIFVAFVITLFHLFVYNILSFFLYLPSAIRRTFQTIVGPSSGLRHWNQKLKWGSCFPVCMGEMFPFIASLQK